MTITVVLADDHSVLRDGLRYLLDAQADIAVTGDAADGTEAVRLVEKLRPDIVLMDIAMPGLNGIEATHEIGLGGAPSQVIILSMHNTVEHIVRALRAGARGYLLKESAGAEVVGAVRAVYAGHCFLSPKISDTLIGQYIQKSDTAEILEPLESLSLREREVLQLIAEGRSNQEIADCLCLSPKTVETYRSRLMQKLEIDDLATLVKFAIKHGVTSLE